MLSFVSGGPADPLQDFPGAHVPHMGTGLGIEGGPSRNIVHYFTAFYFAETDGLLQGQVAIDELADPGVANGGGLVSESSLSNEGIAVPEDIRIQVLPEAADVRVTHQGPDENHVFACSSIQEAGKSGRLGRGGYGFLGGGCRFHGSVRIR